MSDQAPFAWFKRVGLPPLGWLFVVGAAVVAAVHLADLPTSPLDVAAALGHLLRALAATATALLPAALLWRIPDAHRRHPPLLAGLALVALATLANSVLRRADLGFAELGLLHQLAYSVDLLGLLLVALGLLRLRGDEKRRPLLLVAMLVAYAAGWLAPPLLVGAEIGIFDLARSLGATAVIAFAHWVPFSAWLDASPPRLFWGLLALAVPVALAQLAMNATAIVLVDEAQAGLFALTNVPFAVLGAGVAIAALVAYGRSAPRD